MALQALMDKYTILQNIYVQVLLITMGVIIGAKILTWIINKIMPLFTSSTKTDIDDRIIEATSKPLVYGLIAWGLRYAVVPLSLSEPAILSIEKIFDSIVIAIGAYIVIVIVDILINSWGENWAKKTKATIDDELLPLIKKASKVTFVIIGLMMILNRWNIDVTGILAGLGIAGIALGFAVKDSLANIFGGLSLLLDRAYKVGDVITVDNKTGTVIDVGLRSTRIKTFDNELIVIPNGQLSTTAIQNQKKPDLSVRAKVPFGVDYGSDVNKVKKIITKVLEGIDKVVKKDENKPIQVLFLEMGDSALLFEARFWVDESSDRFATKEKAVCKIYDALNKEGIGIPYPTRRVYMHNVDVE